MMRRVPLTIVSNIKGTAHSGNWYYAKKIGKHPCLGVSVSVKFLEVFSTANKFSVPLPVDPSCETPTPKLCLLISLSR